MTDNNTDDEHGPHGPDCACHIDTEEIRTEAIEAIESADCFAFVAASLDENGEPDVTTGRASGDISFPTLLGLQQIIDFELSRLSSDSPLSMSDVLAGSEETAVIPVSAEEAEETGLLELIEQLTGESISSDTASVEEALEDFDGVDIDIE